MTQDLHFGAGAAGSCLPAALRRMGAQRVFLVTGQRSFVTSGAAEALRAALRDFEVERFSHFDENPKLSDVLRAIDARRRAPFDAVVAVGGGSAIDIAKLANLLAVQEHDPIQMIRGEATPSRRGLPLISVPTTAGSGSEATHFAVVYVDGDKHSVAHPYALPDVAIVDPTLTFSLPPALTAVTGLDAFAQAVESYWCVHSTPESREDARMAIQLVLEHLARAVRSPTAESRAGMSRAAYLAGRAINVTKTTAPHAVSYPMTAFFGVPHGHAVALTLGEFLVYNSQVTETDVIDPRGAEYVRRTVGELVTMLGCRDAAEARDAIVRLLRDVGVETRLGAIGVWQHDWDLIVGHVNADRIRNNPRAVTRESIRTLLQAIG